MNLSAYEVEGIIHLYGNRKERVQGWGIKQTEIASFNKTSISKLERRKDMNLSTLKV